MTYCMNDDDVDFLAKLNHGKDVDGRDRKDKLSQCSENIFEEVMNFFEETSARIQPFATVDNAPILSLREMEQSVDDSISAEAQQWFQSIYKYWVLKKGSRPLMPSIKVRVLDTTSEADDADPYVCFRRREVRQTRKTRGRDAQVVEKLKKLRNELESARQLVQLVRERENLNKENLEVGRKVFEQRRQLKEVKITKNIIGDKGDDEELLVNQKPVIKLKARQDTGQQRPPVLRIGSGNRSAPENDLWQLSDHYAEAEQHVNNTIESRKEQHKKWNQKWVDATWRPITPPPETPSESSWRQVVPVETQLPSPPPTLPSEHSQDKDGDLKMVDTPPPEKDIDATTGAEEEPISIFHIPGPSSDDEEAPHKLARKDQLPFCRIRHGRGGRRWLETRKPRSRGLINCGVVSDDDSDEDNGPDYFSVRDGLAFEYRVMLNLRNRPEGMSGERRQWASGDQSAMAGAVAGHGQSPALQRQISGGSSG